MADWKKTAYAGMDISSLGNGLAYAFGALTASVSSGLTFDGSGNIIVKNGSGIALDGTGHVTVNAGVGLTISGGFLTVNAGTGLSTSGGTVFIPGGAITNSLLAALAVATANIQAGAVTSTQIASATITTANIANAAITTALIANAAITNALLGSAVVGTANIQNAAITTALIANAAIGSAQIGSAVIVGANIASATITDANIVNISASKISAGTITASIGMTAGLFFNVGNTTIGNNAIGMTSSPYGCSMQYTGFSWVHSGLYTFSVGDLGMSLVGLNFYCGVQVVIDGSSNGFFQNLKISGLPQFAGTNSTGSGAASLGSNCPAGGSLAAPNTWLEVKNASGTAGWIPMWV